MVWMNFPGGLCDYVGKGGCDRREARGCSIQTSERNDNEHPSAMKPATAELSALYRELGPSLLGYFRRQPGVGGRAEDLLQDTFLRAWRGRDRWPETVSARAWLFGIARHVRLDALRRQRPEELLTTEVPVCAEEEDPRLETMREVIDKLPEPQRETLLLKLRHELTYEEIAEVLGVPVGTVRSRLHNAVNRLKEALNPL